MRRTLQILRCRNSSFLLPRHLANCRQATLTVAAKGLGNPDEAGAASSDYLRLFALVAMGYMWARMAKVAAEKLPTAGDRTEFYDARLKIARFFMARVLPEAEMRIPSGDGGRQSDDGYAGR